MTTFPTHLDAEIELGVMFARVRASIIVFDNGMCVGAHVDLDGNVLGDTGLTTFNGDAFDAAIMLRNFARQAVRMARAEIGLDDEGDSVANLTAIFRALPLRDEYAGMVL